MRAESKLEWNENKPAGEKSFTRINSNLFLRFELGTGFHREREFSPRRFYRFIIRENSRNSRKGLSASAELILATPTRLTYFDRQ